MLDIVLNAKKKKRMKNPASADKRLLIIPLLILILTASTDQLSKKWAVANLAEGETHQVIGEFFQVRLIYNEGGAMGTNFGGPNFYLISALVILTFVLYFIYANRSERIITASMGLIAGGAIGNLIDRFQLGKVIDFLDFEFFNFSFFGRTIDRWWTFNIADSAITVGIIILMIYIIFFSKASKRNRSAVFPSATNLV